LTRVGISIPGDLLERFDQIVSEKGFPSRSEAIQDAVRLYIQYYEWMESIKGERAGTIIVIYDEMKRGLIELIANLQRDFRGIIRSIMILSLNDTERRRMELLILHGDGRSLVTLAEQMQRLNGVQYVKLTTMPESMPQGTNVLNCNSPAI